MPYLHITAEPNLDAPRTTTVETGRWYPDPPPMLLFESVDDYTNRLVGVTGEGCPYDHRRNRQCSIGFHDECTDPHGATCRCPCHTAHRASRG